MTTHTTHPVTLPNGTTAADDTATATPQTVDAAAAVPALPEQPNEVMFTLAGRLFTVGRPAWKDCRRLTVLLASVGTAMGAGQGAEEKTLDDLTQAVAIGAGLTVADLDAMTVEPIEIYAAFNELLRITGLDRYQVSEFHRLRELARNLMPQALHEQVFSGLPH